MAAEVSAAGGMVLGHVSSGFDIPVDLHSQGAESRITLAPKLSLHAPKYERAPNRSADTRSDELRNESLGSLLLPRLRKGNDIVGALLHGVRHMKCRQLAGGFGIASPGGDADKLSLQLPIQDHADPKCS